MPSDPGRVLTALGRLQGAAEGTIFEPLVKDLVDAMAADTTAADLRQEIEFVKASFKRRGPVLDRAADIDSSG